MMCVRRMLATALLLCLGIGNLQARTYYLPDYQNEFIYGGRINTGENNRPSPVKPTCASYGLHDSFQSSMACSATPQHPAPGLTCYSCAACSSEYAYDSSNCSGNYVTSGSSCGGKYTKCICDRSKFPGSGSGEGCPSGQKIDAANACKGPSDTSTVYKCTEDSCYGVILKNACETQGRYCVASSSCPAGCEQCIDRCEGYKNHEGAIKCDNGCMNPSDQISGCTGLCKAGATCKPTSCGEGYELSGDTCIPKNCAGYLDACPAHAVCNDTCKSGSDTKYKPTGCNTGYTLNTSATACLSSREACIEAFSAAGYLPVTDINSFISAVDQNKDMVLLNDLDMFDYLTDYYPGAQNFTIRRSIYDLASIGSRVSACAGLSSTPVTLELPSHDADGQASFNGGSSGIHIYPTLAGASSETTFSGGVNLYSGGVLEGFYYDNASIQLYNSSYDLGIWAPSASSLEIQLGSNADLMVHYISTEAVSANIRMAEGTCISYGHYKYSVCATSGTDINVRGRFVAPTACTGRMNSNGTTCTGSIRTNCPSGTVPMQLETDSLEYNENYGGYFEGYGQYTFPSSSTYCPMKYVPKTSYTKCPSTFPSATYSDDGNCMACNCGNVSICPIKTSYQGIICAKASVCSDYNENVMGWETIFSESCTPGNYTTCVTTSLTGANGQICKFEANCIDDTTCAQYTMVDMISNPSNKAIREYGERYCTGSDGSDNLLWIDPQCSNPKKLCLRCDVSCGSGYTTANKTCPSGQSLVTETNKPGCTKCVACNCGSEPNINHYYTEYPSDCDIYGDYPGCNSQGMVEFDESGYNRDLNAYNTCMSNCK